MKLWYDDILLSLYKLISAEVGSSDGDICGASAHSDYGMITLLATDGVRGLQACFLLLFIY